VRLFFRTVILTAISFYANAQERWNLSVGVGAPEALNLGVRYQLKQAQISINYGIFPSREMGFQPSKLFVVSTSFSQHLCGQSTLSERKPWFLKGGMSYLRVERESNFARELYISTLIGRDININTHHGCSIGIGVFSPVVGRQFNNSGTTENSLSQARVIYPALEVNYFYRLFN
jgi:hypothetical protein